MIEGIGAKNFNCFSLSSSSMQQYYTHIATRLIHWSYCIALIAFTTYFLCNKSKVRSSHHLPSGQNWIKTITKCIDFNGTPCLEVKNREEHVRLVHGSSIFWVYGIKGNSHHSHRVSLSENSGHHFLGILGVIFREFRSLFSGNSGHYSQGIPAIILREFRSLSSGSSSHHSQGIPVNILWELLLALCPGGILCVHDSKRLKNLD